MLIKVKLWKTILEERMREKEREGGREKVRDREKEREGERERPQYYRKIVTFFPNEIPPRL
jgi:hypothetical protein